MNIFMIRDNNASPTNIVEVLRLPARGLRSKIGGGPLGYSGAQPSIGVVIGTKVILEVDSAFCKALRIRVITLVCCLSVCLWGIARREGPRERVLKRMIRCNFVFLCF